MDGTYVRHEKSKNNNYQRKSFSGHKKVPLCKPFTICTTDGYIVDFGGPYLATQNDAEILKHMMSIPNGIRKLLKKGDVFVLDRGFRDVKKMLEDEGFIVLMPALKGNRHQLTTEESNASRLVTKLRWVVEAVHGIIGKKYRLLHNQLDNKLLPVVGNYIKIAGLINNLYGKRLNSDDGLQEEIINHINSRMHMPNTFAEEVESWGRKRKIFKEIASTEILDFPELSEQNLKILFTGTYQLNQSVSYLAEIMGAENIINLSYYKPRQDTIKVIIQSRHINRKQYKVYIQYKPNSSGIDSILQYVCDCPNGLRTIGCCSHVACVIYYLSHARYLSRIVRPAEILSKIFVQENIEPVINDDSDED